MGSMARPPTVTVTLEVLLPPSASSTVSVTTALPVAPGSAGVRPIHFDFKSPVEDQ